MFVAPRLSLPILALLGLAACASGPELEVSSHGRLPVTDPATFAMIRSEGDDPSLQAASAAVAEAFAVRGWHAEAAVPQWRIEALYVERPRSLGAFVEQAAPEESDGWRISPTPHRWWRRDGRVGVLAVRIVDAATGAEVVRAEAKSRIAAEPTGQIGRAHV